MKLNIDREVKILKGMCVADLREKYREVFGETPRCSHKTFLWKRIAWRMQAMAEGGLSERAKRRAEELANDADLRIRAPKGFYEPNKATAPERTTIRSFSPSHDRRIPMPGSNITREYEGEVIRVTVLDNGFKYNGQNYRSLTAIAKAVTGTHWNGYLFFNLKDKKSKNETKRKETHG